MAYIGKVPANVPLTSSDIADGIISTADIANTAVTGAKVNTDIISAQTALASAPADTDEFLVSDAGTIKRIDYSHIKGGGAYTKLLTTTISSATDNIDFNSTYITSTYTDYMFIISGFNAQSEAPLQMFLSADNGSSFKNDIYFISKGIGSNDGESDNRNDSGNATNMTIACNSVRAEADGNGWFEIHLLGHTDTDNCVSAQWTGGFEDNSGRAHAITGGWGFDTGTPRTCNFIRLKMSTGGVSKGIFTLYGRSA